MTENGVISAPISISDVGKTIGSGSTDIGTLCTHPSINKWSKHKPVDSIKLTALDDEEFIGQVSKDYNLQIANADGDVWMNNFTSESFQPSEVVDVLKNYKWVYRKVGTSGLSRSVYRLTDFDGYFHRAQPFIKMANDNHIVLNKFVSSAIYFTATMYEPEDANEAGLSISLEDVANTNIGNLGDGVLNNMKLGVLLVPQGATPSTTNTKRFIGEATVGDGEDLSVDVDSADVETGVNYYAYVALTTGDTFDKVLPVPDSPVFDVRVISQIPGYCVLEGISTTKAHFAGSSITSLDIREGSDDIEEYQSPSLYDEEYGGESLPVWGNYGTEKTGLGICLKLSFTNTSTSRVTLQEYTTNHSSVTVYFQTGSNVQASGGVVVDAGDTLTFYILLVGDNPEDDFISETSSVQFIIYSKEAYLTQTPFMYTTKKTS